MTDDELRAALVDAAYLEGDFVLRSGKRSSYYFDKYRFETRPDLLAPIGERIAAIVAEHEPDAVRLAAPALGGVVLAAAAALVSGLPFLMIRDAAKEYGTANRIEGPFEAGETVCFVEDVVTSGGALLETIAARPRSGARRAHRSVRRRPRRGRIGRSRAPRGTAPSALSGRIPAAGAESFRLSRPYNRDG